MRNIFTRTDIIRMLILNVRTRKSPVPPLYTQRELLGMLVRGG